MPAKRRAPAKKKRVVTKKKVVAKKRAAVAKKRAAAKKRRAAKKPATRTPSRRTAMRGVPTDLVRLAERSATSDRRRREAEHQRAPIDLDDELLALDEGPEEPEEIRDRLSEASRPGPLLQERRHQLIEESPADTVFGEVQELRYTQQAAPHANGDVVIDVEDLHVFYGAVEALKGISFRVNKGETVSIIGSNGAGKTTTLKTVSGVSELLKTVRGRVTILGKRVEAWPAHRIARLGVAHSPEGRKIFPNQTVRDNLMLGAFGRRDSEIEDDIAQMEARFPILGKRRNQAAGLMSGGEQQMLAMARALMARPEVLLFDEPSMGLAPLIVKQIFDIIEELKREGKTILLVEQMAFQALGIADRAYVLETGAITMEGTGRTLLEDPRVKEAYLGA